MNRQPGSAPRSRAPRGGFTLAEVLIASATGMTTVAAVLSLYLFISDEGRALRAQVEFNNRTRVLQTVFADLVESSYCLLVDEDNRGVRLYSDESALEVAAGAGGEDPAEWIGYEEGPTVRESRIVYRRNGKGSEPARTLCEWVGPADGGAPMFRLVTGISCALNAHVGDPAAGSSEPDTTGPGRQGMNVAVIGSCRNLRRKL